MRKVMRFVAASSVVFVLVVSAAWAGVHLKYQRDEAAYVAYLAGDDGQSATATSSDVPATGIVALPPSAALIAEGDLACDWLAERPHALWRTGARFRSNDLQAKYVQQSRDRRLPWTGGVDRRSVTAGAWTYLCPATWELRKPRTFGRDSDQD